jgi:hypothetical protein
LEKAKQTTKVLNELTDTYIDTYHAVKTTAKNTEQTKRLWREGNKSNLIKIGVACIVFPDPSPVGEIIGAGFLVAGAVQKGIQNRAAYVGDIKKSVESTVREINRTRSEIRI